MWDAVSRRRVTRLPVPDTPTAVRFSPDGRLLAVGYQHGRSHLWSTASWKPVTRMLVGDAGNIHALAISPNGRTLATGSRDRTVRLWDIETQQAIGPARRSPAPAAASARSPRTSHPTAPRSSPATTPAAPTAGTSGPAR